jgi:uncharacterized protein (TIGR02996 family)
MRIDNPSLFAAVCAQPDDDALRLIYADWLEDHDEPDRAQFIRLQCAHPIELTPVALAPVWSVGSTICHTVLDRESLAATPPFSWQCLLYTKYVRKWNGVIHRRLRGGPLHRQIDRRRGLVRGWSYRRGFPCTVWAQIDAVGRHTQAVFRIGPIERLNLVGLSPPGELSRMLRALEAYPVRVLDFTKARLPYADLSLLTQSTRFPILDRLERLVAR